MNSVGATAASVKDKCQASITIKSHLKCKGSNLLTVAVIKAEQCLSHLLHLAFTPE